MGRPFWYVPYPRNPAFTGRKDILSDLRKRFTKRGRTALAQAISGLGGIGKTQTAVEYAHRYRDKYQAVLWLNAESLVTLKDDYRKLARRMQLPHPENDLDQAVLLALKGWLETHTGWLLVLDNVDDPEMLGPFLPDAGHGHILLTSRAQDFQNLGIFNPMELLKLPIEDATAFLLHRCGRQEAEAEERDAARGLARELGGLPLALEQAAALIHSTKAPFRLALKGYLRRGLKLLQARGPALGEYPKSVLNTWVANFDAVQEESQAAADVLRLSAFLDLDAIPFALLTKGTPHLGPLVQEALAEANGDPLVVHELLRPLSRFSLIRIDGHDETYSMHPLVKEVLKLVMDDATRHLWTERAVRAVYQARTPTPEKADPMDEFACQMQLQLNQFNNAPTIFTQMQADNEKQAAERWKILKDIQTKIFEIVQDVTANRAQTQWKAFEEWDNYIRM